MSTGAAVMTVDAGVVGAESRAARASAGGEVSASWPCFGSSCSAHVSGPSAERSAQEAVQLVGSTLRRWHEQFSRFEPGSELSRLNGDPRGEVPVSPLMARLAQAVSDAAAMTGGLVDATLIDEIERAGYSTDLAGLLPLADALALAPPRRPAAAARSGAGWRSTWTWSARS